MSSSLIQYAYVFEKVVIYSLVPDENFQSGAIGAIEEGKGVCRQFSYIASDFMKALGLKAKPVANTRQPGWHEVVRVKVEGKKYLMEPQRSDCTFYPVPKETL